MADDARMRAARAAKAKARRIFGGRARVTSVGITHRDGEPCVKVNLAEEPAQDVELPDRIDGVRVVVHVSGSVRKQRG